MLTEVKPVQLQNTPCPIEVIVLGIVTDVNLPHPEKTQFSIEVTEKVFPSKDTLLGIIKLPIIFVSPPVTRAFPLIIL